VTVLTFATTDDALRAERVAAERGLGARVVPAPASAAAKCGLALECLPEDVPALVAALTAADVRYGVYVRSGAV
jgi:hypothetical protein